MGEDNEGEDMAIYVLGMSFYNGFSNDLWYF